MHTHTGENRKPALSVLGRNVVATVALGALVASAHAADVVIGTNGKPGNPRVTAAEMLGDMLEQRSRGKFTVKVAHSATLGDDRQMLKSVRRRSTPTCTCSPSGIRIGSTRWAWPSRS